MRAFAIAMALAGLVLALPAGAQETRMGPEGFESPPATIDQASWLVGQWSGTGIGGAPAHESWLPPTGKTMVGTFVQETGEGAIQFSEILYLMEEEGTLVLRLKHFNADLTGWEERDDMLSFRLVAIEDCAAYFHALTLRCDGEDGLLAAVRMKSTGEDVNELVFRFGRISEKPRLTYDNSDCEIHTTRGYEQCFARRVSEARDAHARYLAAARATQAHDESTSKQIDASEASFQAYVEAECGAIYSRVREGTIRNASYLSCEEDLVRRRTHTIWRNWLTPPWTDGDAYPEPLLRE